MAKNIPAPIDPAFLDNDQPIASAADVPAQGLVIDFSAVPSQDPIPNGMYNAVIKRAKQGVSGTGNGKIDLQWAVEGGDHDGRIVFDTLAFHPNALWRVRDTLRAIGFPENFKGAIDPEALLGEVAVIEVGTRPIKRNGNEIDPNTNKPYGNTNTVERVHARGAIKTVEDLI
jgi:hypothetical protein